MSIVTCECSSVRKCERHQVTAMHCVCHVRAYAKNTWKTIYTYINCPSLLVWLFIRSIRCTLVFRPTKRNASFHHSSYSCINGNGKQFLTFFHDIICRHICDYYYLYSPTKRNENKNLILGKLPLHVRGAAKDGLTLYGIWKKLGRL